MNWLEEKAPTCDQVSEVNVAGLWLWLSMESLLVMRISFTLIKEGLLGKGLSWPGEFARVTFTCIIACSLEAHRAGFPRWLVDVLSMPMSLHLAFVRQQLLQQSGLAPYFALVSIEFNPFPTFCILTGILPVCKLDTVNSISPRWEYFLSIFCYLVCFFFIGIRRLMLVAENMIRSLASGK